MARKKYVPLKFWQTATKGDEKEKQYIRLGNTLLKHPKYCNLTCQARAVYTHMMQAAGANQEFTFPHSFYTKLGLSKATVQRAVKELEEAGFIRVKENGKLTRTPNVYQFVWDWKSGK